MQVGDGTVKVTRGRRESSRAGWVVVRERRQVARYGPLCMFEDNGQTLREHVMAGTSAWAAEWQRAAAKQSKLNLDEIGTRKIQGR